MGKFAEIPAGGSYFKPAEYAHAAALMIEVKAFEPQVPTNYGPKDTITADITTFASIEDAQNDRGTLTTGVKVQQVDLARKLQQLGVGGATIVRLEKLEPTAKLPNGAWVWRPVDGDLKNAVIEYDERKEAALKEALSGDDVPDFMK